MSYDGGTRSWRRASDPGRARLQSVSPSRSGSVRAWSRRSSRSCEIPSSASLCSCQTIS